jgi:hypothetical protein
MFYLTCLMFLLVGHSGMSTATGAASWGVVWRGGGSREGGSRGAGDSDRGGGSHRGGGSRGASGSRGVGGSRGGQQ